MNKQKEALRTPRKQGTAADKERLESSRQILMNGLASAPQALGRGLVENPSGLESLRSVTEAIKAEAEERNEKGKIVVDVNAVNAFLQSQEAKKAIEVAFKASISTKGVKQTVKQVAINGKKDHEKALQNGAPGDSDANTLVEDTGSIVSESTLV